MITKVISGGQVGVDIAALRAARKAGIKTGGWAPNRFRIKDGFNPELGSVYGLTETQSHEYPPRTRNNVQYSDATVLLAFKLTSPGERCTLKAIKRFKKPAVAVAIVLDQQRGEFSIPYGQVLLEFLEVHKPKTLNVAGNAMPAIEEVVENFLYTIFTTVNGRSESDANEKNT